VNDRTEPIPKTLATQTSEPIEAIQIYIARPISTLKQRPGGWRRTIPVVMAFATVGVLVEMKTREMTRRISRGEAPTRLERDSIPTRG
jgi:hypothetical protein